MLDYMLNTPIAQDKILKILKKHIQDKDIVEMGLNKKGQTYITTNWFTYTVWVKDTRLKLPVMWSPRKKPYLIAGILLVLFSMFNFGAGITDILMIGVFLGIGSVNAFKRTEIVEMRKTILKALSVCQ